MYKKFFKRFFDVACSLFALILLSPLFAVISLAIKLDSKGPVFFRQKRIGLNKSEFYIHKFRTMKTDAPHDMPTHMLNGAGAYITRVGKFLRKSSLDELPQIYDIFVGKMSIVGPRPALWNQYDLIAERDKYGANGLKPGLTGLAQVKGRDELEIAVKAKYDGEYVKKCSFFFDIGCIVSTMFGVLCHRGVVEGGTGEIKKEEAENVSGAIKKIPFGFALKDKKILVVSQHYYPEQFRITDVCETLAANGNDVTVLCGLPNYNFPGENVPEEYKKGHRRETINGVKLIRCNERGRKHGAINKFLNYYSFVFSSKKAVKKLPTDFDFVLVNQLSPVMQAEAAVKYAKKYKKPLYIYCLDLWPASLTAGGIKKKSIVYKCFNRISAKIYRAADKILVTSRAFSEYFQKEFAISADKIGYLPQYAEELFSEKIISSHAKSAHDFVFAGNIGKVQGVSTIIKCAKSLSDRKDIIFHIVGGGSDLENCKALAVGLSNVKFYGKLPISEMPHFYSIADAMLVTLSDNELISRTLPGKIQSYMAASKPVLGAANGEIRDVIEQSRCGFCVKAGDWRGLKECILKFISVGDESFFGANSRIYYENNFTAQKFFERLSEYLSEKKI